MRNILFAAATALSVASTGAWAQDGGDSAALAKQLSNPVASLISVPFQFNYDTGYGPADGEKAFVNVQPVIPIHRRRAQAERRMDLRDARQPHLVVCRRRQPSRHQFDLPPAVPLVHDAECVELHAQHGEHL